MATTVHPEASKNSLYWIPKHRYYELKHFVMQYPDWKKKLLSINGFASKSPILLEQVDGGPVPDPTVSNAEARQLYKDRIEMIEKTALRAAGGMGMTLIDASANEITYDKLITKKYLPVSRDEWYKIYRRFFWLLDLARR